MSTNAEWIKNSEGKRIYPVSDLHNTRYLPYMHPDNGILPVYGVWQACCFSCFPTDLPAICSLDLQRKFRFIISFLDLLHISMALVLDSNNDRSTICCFQAPDCDLSLGAWQGKDSNGNNCANVQYCGRVRYDIYQDVLSHFPCYILLEKRIDRRGNVHRYIKEIAKSDGKKLNTIYRKEDKK